MKKLKLLIICFILSLFFSGNLFACEDATAASLGPSDDLYFDGDIINYTSAFGASAPTQFVPDPCAVTNIVAWFLDPSDADEIDDISNPCAEINRPLGTVVYDGGPGVVLQPGESIFIDKDTNLESAVMEYTVQREDGQIIGDDLTLFAAICYDYDRITDDGLPVEGSGNQRTSDNSLLDPNFSVEKDCTADGDLIGGEEKAPFDVIITNRGNVDMDFVVEDPNDSDINGTYPIAAGQSLTLKASVDTECPSSSVENLVTVTALIDGEPAELIDKEPNTNPASASDTCPVICPGCEVVKACDAPDGTVEGTDAPFTSTITNTGDTPLSIDWVDPPANTGGTIQLSPGETSDVPAGISTTGECDLDSSVENSIEILCYVPGIAEPVDSDIATAVCPVDCPDCEVVKLCDLEPGQTISQKDDAPFQITITNPGDVPITVDVTDPEAPLANGTYAIAPGGQEIIDVAISAAGECLLDKQVDNTVSVDCKVQGQDIVFKTVGDIADCPVSCNMDFTVDKGCLTPEGETPGQIPVGEDAPFKIKIENIGEVPVNCTVDDSDAVPPLNGVAVGPIDPGDTEPIDIVVSVEECLNAEVGNSVTVTCTGDGQTDTKGDDAICPCGMPCIEVEKVCTDETTAVMEGDDIDFKIIIKNCGDVELNDIIVTDPEYGEIPNQGPLAPKGELGDTIEIPVILGPAVCVESDLFLPDYELETQKNTVTVEVLEYDLEDSCSAVCPCDVPQACWLTAGGVKFDNIVRERLATVSTMAKKGGPKDSVGGVAYPGCSEFPSNGGQWNHVFHSLDMHLIGKDIQVIRCGNVPGIEPGSESPVCPVNFIEFQGQGVVKGIHGNKMEPTPVDFFVRAEDRNEPGNEHAADGDDIDRYFLRVVGPEPVGTIVVDQDGNPETVDGITITGGNFQIHCTSCDE